MNINSQEKSIKTETHFSIIMNTKIKDTTLKHWGDIKNFFKSFSFRDWLLLIVSILLLCFFLRTRHLSSQLREANQNYTTEITSYINKASDEYKARQLAVLSLSDAKKENSELKEEIKNLKDHPVIITKIKTDFRVDTVLLETVHEIIPRHDTVPETHIFNWGFSHPENYYSLNGHSSISSDFRNYSSVLDKLSVDSKMTVDLIDDGKNLKIITRSDNPYVNISDVNSVVIDPRKSPVIKKYFPQKRWGIGPSISFGVNQDIKPSWNLGISIHYSIFQF